MENNENSNHHSSSYISSFVSPLPISSEASEPNQNNERPKTEELHLSDSSSGYLTIPEITPPSSDYASVSSVQFDPPAPPERPNDSFVFYETNSSTQPTHILGESLGSPPKTSPPRPDGSPDSFTLSSTQFNERSDLQSTPESRDPIRAEDVISPDKTPSFCENPHAQRVSTVSTVGDSVFFRRASPLKIQSFPGPGLDAPELVSSPPLPETAHGSTHDTTGTPQSNMESNYNNKKLVRSSDSVNSINSLRSFGSVNTHSSPMIGQNPLNIRLASPYNNTQRRDISSGTIASTSSKHKNKSKSSFSNRGNALSPLSLLGPMGPLGLGDPNPTQKPPQVSPQVPMTNSSGSGIIHHIDNGTSAGMPYSITPTIGSPSDGSIGSFGQFYIPATQPMSGQIMDASLPPPNLARPNANLTRSMNSLRSKMTIASKDGHLNPEREVKKHELSQLRRYGKYIYLNQPIYAGVPPNAYYPPSEKCNDENFDESVDLWGRKHASMQIQALIVLSGFCFPPLWMLIGAGFCDNVFGVISRKLKLVSLGLSVVTLIIATTLVVVFSIVHVY